MGLRSTVLLAAPVAFLVWVSFASEPSLDPPPASTLPVTWVRVPVDGVVPPPGGRFSSVAFDSAGFGLVASTQVQILTREDGGSAWQVTRSPAGAVNTTSVAVREDGLVLASVQNGRIFRSTDAGTTWAMVREPGRSIQELAILGGDTALAVGTATALQSVDGGESWYESDAPVAEHVWYDVAFASPQVGYIVGGIGQILRTTDGGGTWTRMAKSSEAVLRGVAVLDERHAVIVGSGGEVLRTDDQGSTWEQVPSGTDQLLTSVAFLGTDDGVAVGLYGTVITTADGGRTWIAENSGTDAHLHDVAFDPDGAAVAVGWLGTMVRKRVGRDVRQDRAP